MRRKCQAYDKNVRTGKGVTYRRIRRLNRNAYVPSNSPLIKETVVMLQDDPRSPYGKNVCKAETTVVKPSFKHSTVRYQNSKQDNVTILAENSSISKSYARASSSDRQINRPKTTNLHASECKLPALTKYHTNKPDTMKIAIIAKGNSISKSQVDVIKTYLLDRIDNIPEGGPSPGFTYLNYKSGHVIVYCSNKTSRDWLVNEIHNLILWDEIKLKVVEASKIEKLVKTVVQIPGLYIQPQKLLRRLKIQNAGLDTTLWQVVGENADKESYTYFINLDERSWQKIMNLDGRLYLNFSQITFKTTNELPLNNNPSASDNETTVTSELLSSQTTRNDNEHKESAEAVYSADTDTKVDINFQKEELFISAGEFMAVDSVDDQICKVDEPISCSEC